MDKTTISAHGQQQKPAKRAGVFPIGGDLLVHRLGFGAMRVTGSGMWGEPRDPDEAVRVLRRTVELGIDFIDTADSYGPYVSERLIATALHPYAPGPVIATKAGLVRPGPDQWTPDGVPNISVPPAKAACGGCVWSASISFSCTGSTRVPAADQFGVLKELQDEGKIRHVGLSEVTVGHAGARRVA